MRTSPAWREQETIRIWILNPLHFATMNWNIEPKITLTSITGYEHFTRPPHRRHRWHWVQYLDATYRNRINQFSQELRLAYHGDGLELIVGGFYSHDQVQTRDEFSLSDLLPLLASLGSTLSATLTDSAQMPMQFSRTESGPLLRA
jgi:hypothetical protein